MAARYHITMILPNGRKEYLGGFTSLIKWAEKIEAQQFLRGTRYEVCIREAPQTRPKRKKRAEDDPTDVLGED